jgi:Lon protease-like protein
MVASVIYFETLELFNTHCKIIQNISDVDGLIMNQKVKVQVKERVRITSEMESSYARACRQYNRKIDEEQDNRFMSKEVSQLLSNINSKLPDNVPDRNPNEIEYIAKLLYKKNELSAYYALAKEYKFDLKGLIYDWVKKLILVIHHIE